MTSGDISGISDETIEIYSLITFGVLCQTINIFGIVTNVINIICFVIQGFDDSINVSLLGLAVSDLGSFATMVWTCISVTPAFSRVELPFEPMEVMYLVSAMPHVSFTRVSSCITAMITIERCLCITAPLKIKNIITPKRATVVTICMFVFFFSTGTPVYAVCSLGSTFSLLRNKTLVGLISSEDRVNVEMISFAVNNFAIPFGAFIIIVVCTSILSFELRSQLKWRKKTLNSSKDDRVSSRNKKAARMVVMISTLFIVCFIPVSVTMLAAGLIPDLLINGKYIHISTIIAGFGYIMESINSSTNVLIYYYMSSVYRENLLKLFR